MAGSAARRERFRIHLHPSLGNAFDQRGLQSVDADFRCTLQISRIAFVSRSRRVLNRRDPRLMTHQSEFTGDGIKRLG